jgi:hypothetical protein
MWVNRSIDGKAWAPPPRGAATTDVSARRARALTTSATDPSVSSVDGLRRLHSSHDFARLAVRPAIPAGATDARRRAADCRSRPVRSSWANSRAISRPRTVDTTDPHQVTGANVSASRSWTLSPSALRTSHGDPARR